MGRPIASDTLNPSPHYRRECFRAGLERVGFTSGLPPLDRPGEDDVLVIWNRSPKNEEYARRYESAGARVLVTENGYIGKDSSGHQLYALAIGHHLGAGSWPVGPTGRWDSLGVDIEPWRASGAEIIVLPQRGIGEPGIAMPKTWTDEVVARLRKVTDRPIRVRLHPGKERTDPYADLANAWAAVTWASGAGIKSLIAGVPVFHEMPSWIGGRAAKLGIDQIETPFLGDRLPMLQRLAWAQFTVDEISSGDAFRWLLG